MDNKWSTFKQKYVDQTFSISQKHTEWNENLSPPKNMWTSNVASLFRGYSNWYQIVTSTPKNVSVKIRSFELILQEV